MFQNYNNKVNIKIIIFNKIVIVNKYAKFYNKSYIYL